MQCIIDRFEGDYAVIEYHDKVYKLPKVFLPGEVFEGEVLDVIVMLDDAETLRMKTEVRKLIDDAWESP